MDESNSDALPHINQICEAMRLPKRPIEVDRFAPNACDAIVQWKRIHTVAILAGLMTEVRYQVNATRLDWLVRLVIARSTGAQKPTKRELSAILNGAFASARVTRLEDPIEDLFCDVVPTAQGDRLIFTGHWEHAAAYTDTLLTAFENLRDHPMKQMALRAADALLKLSDALAKRARLTRRAYEANAPWDDISLPDNDTLKTLARRVKFTNAELERLGIERQALAPFILESAHFAFAASELPGNSPLDFYPLIELNDGILVARPGNLSIAVRAMLLQTASDGGVATMLLGYLGVAQESYSEWSGFWPTRELRLSAADRNGLRASICTYAPGRYQHVVQVPILLDNFPARAFGGFTRLPDSICAAIRDHIIGFWDFLSKQPDYREAISVLLLCGWGEGISFSVPIEPGAAPKGWRFLPLSFADAAQLGACRDGKLKHLWRVIEQVELMEQLGYSVSNINGTINLFGNWRETHGQFIPEHMVDVEPPCNIALPIDDLFKPRLEAAENRDIRTLPFPGGSFRRVQRVNWGLDGPLKPIYGSIDDATAMRLIGAVAVPDKGSEKSEVGQVWWVEGEQDKSGSVPFDWQYQVWNAIMQWLAAAAPQIVSDFADKLPAAPRHLKIILLGGNPPDDAPATTDGPFGHFELREEADGTGVVTVSQTWMNALKRPENEGELALVAVVLQQLLTTGHGTPSAEEIQASVKRALPSSDWRWLHAGAATSLMDRLTASGLIGKFREIPLSSVALVKCGSVWRFHDRSNGYEFTTEDQCGGFLKSYYDFVLGELIGQIRRFDRRQLAVLSAQNYQAARGEQRLWRRTIRAVRTIRGEAADQTARERQSASNAVQRAAKIVCEIAACEAPDTAGVEPSQEDLDNLFARALLIFGNGQLWASIRAGAVPPHLKISPAGDLLSDRSVFDKTFIPASMRLNAKTLDSASENYLKRGISSEPEPAAEMLGWPTDLRQAVEAEFACSAEAFVDLQFAMMQHAEDLGTGVFLLRRSELHTLLIANEDFPRCDPTGLLNRMILRRREGWLTDLDGLLTRDMDLSRFDRRSSLINRPLLALSDDDDPLLLVAPAIMHDATKYLIGSLHEGTLHNDFWSSGEARAYAGARADALGAAFEDSIVMKLTKLGLEASARRSITGILEQSTASDMGDVDVLAISQDGGTVWSIEAKNLRLCRTEAEVASRMSEYRGVMRTDEKGRHTPDKMLRHLTRVRFLRENAVLLGTRLKLGGVPEVKGLMVVDAPQPMIFHMTDPDAACCMLDDLNSRLGQPSST